MVHGMVMVHNIRWVTCQLHHHRSTTSTSSTATASNTPQLQLHLWHENNIKETSVSYGV